MSSHLISSGQGAQPKVTKRHSAAGSITHTYEFPYMSQQPKRTFGQLIYDSSKGKVLGRTPKNWGQLFVFYTIFYIALAALFAICMQVLFMTLNTNSPKWKLNESLIGTNPGLGFRPISENVDQGSLIWYDASNQSQILHWTNLVDSFLKEYTFGSSNQKNCDFNDLPRSGQVCKSDLTKFDKCSKDNSYGYNNSAPCIFLKLNRIYGWVPDYYNNPDDLPEDMPETLKAHIKALPKENRNQVWVSCKGEYGADQEILGDTEYYPTQGFPSYFYPYTNTPGYLSPLVAVKFTRPTPNQIINVECRSWAKNIAYSGSHRDRQGSVHFELMIDAP